MPTWAWIIIVIVASLLFILLVSIVCYFLMVSFGKKAFSESKKLDSYEKGRAELILSALDKLNLNGYNFEEKTYDVIKKGSASLESLSPKDREQLKNTMDFVAFYLVKVHKEDKRYGKFISEDDVSEFKKYPDEEEINYKAYNKKAIVYNALFSTLFVKLISKILREKRETLPTY